MSPKMSLKMIVLGVVGKVEAISCRPSLMERTSSARL